MRYQSTRNNVFPSLILHLTLFFFSGKVERNPWFLQLFPSLENVFFSRDKGLCKTRTVWLCFAFFCNRSDMARGPPSINTVAIDDWRSNRLSLLQTSGRRCCFLIFPSEAPQWRFSHFLKTFFTEKSGCEVQVMADYYGA